MSFDERMVAARYNLADIYRKRGDMDKVMELYLEAHKIDPDFGNLNLALASEYLKRKEKDKAVPFLEGAIKKKPRQLEPLKTLGSIYYQKEDWENVIRVYKQIVTLFPKQYTFHQFYVQGLVKTNRIKEALQSLESHIKQHPDDTVAKQQYRQIANALSKAK
jgi:tetratricopeptide (TPR) repeat protein